MVARQLIKTWVWVAFAPWFSLPVAAQNGAVAPAYEQVALDFFVKTVLPNYRFPLAFCGQTNPNLSQFYYLPACFTPTDFALQERLRDAAQASVSETPTSLQWTTNQLKRSCKVRRHRPLLVVCTAIALENAHYVKLYVRGTEGATHYIIELSNPGQVVRWCQQGETF